jgi:hypothetical protein
MQPLTADAVRASFVNVTVRERKAILPPDDLTEHDWSLLDYLGWRDPKSPLLGYVVLPTPDGPVGVLLRQAEATPRSRAQCSWCEDTRLPNDVVFFAAKRAGDAGRKGDTLGTLVCARFECSVNVRRQAPLSYVGFDVEAERQRRILSLRERVAAFADRVRVG